MHIDGKVKPVNKGDHKKKREQGDKILYWALGVIILLIIIAGIFASNGSNENPVATSSSPISIVETPAAAIIPVYKLGQDAKAGTFTYKVSGVTVTDVLKSGYDETKTEDQFVVVKIRITNGDVNPRDISANSFELRDQSGNSYKAFDRNSNVGKDEPLYYETLNPGLSRTRVVIFETPAGISGLTLRADSGVALAGGEFIDIDLGQ
ncbi:DUF4352 domain-containing protein [Cohnella silvisoli]|uniref:DUF4352 domain-containing protein n=1 Tax=Cohnella silvisoli TaxID=2873699 RepID=A0ABV1KZ64_9BACL|nr:DUF4352 domain-containing protein [Cohnella silvisoli]MCD9024299.1 DUF4352 domain-containing protein [Cohnella silvisoli]